MTAILTTTDYRTVLRNVAETLGGSESEAAEVDGLLFARAVLPQEFEVREGDVVNCGIAVKAERQFAGVSPFLFWPASGNGAVLTQPTWQQRFDMNVAWWRSEALDGFATVVRDVGRSRVFDEAAQALRLATKKAAEVRIALQPLYARPFRRPDVFSEYAQRVLLTFLESNDQTEYVAINVVSSVAHDIVEPELKWEFEAAAGDMILKSPHREPHDPQSVAIALPRVAVG